MKDLKIIDFTGIPGSGKSTLSKATYQNMSEKFKCINMKSKRIVKVNKNKVIKYSKLVYLLIRKFNVTYRFLVFYISVKPVKIKNIRHTLHAISLYHTLLSVTKKSSKDDYLILEGGIFHKLWSASLHGKISSKKRLSDLVGLIAKNFDIINFYVDLDKNTAVKRIKNRPTFYSRLDKMSDDEILSTLREDGYNQEVIRNVISAEDKIHTINLNGNDTTREKVSKVINEVSKEKI